MPYDHLEEIQGRKSEKIAMFLTLENAFGLILVAFPAYLISAGMPFALRVQCFDRASNVVRLGRLAVAPRPAGGRQDREGGERERDRGRGRGRGERD